MVTLDLHTHLNLTACPLGYVLHLNNTQTTQGTCVYLTVSDIQCDSVLGVVCIRRAWSLVCKIQMLRLIYHLSGLSKT